MNEKPKQTHPHNAVKSNKNVCNQPWHQAAECCHM